MLSEFEQADELASGLIVTDEAGQTIWHDMIMRRLDEFEYDHDLAVIWRPRGRDVPIVMDPRVAFGSPIAKESGVPTWVFRERIAAGETVSEIADDFGASPTEIRQALDFEGVAAAA